MQHREFVGKKCWAIWEQQDLGYSKREGGSSEPQQGPTVGSPPTSCREGISVQVVRSPRSFGPRQHNAQVYAEKLTVRQSHQQGDLLHVYI